MTFMFKTTCDMSPNVNVLQTNNDFLQNVIDRIIVLTQLATIAMPNKQIWEKLQNVNPLNAVSIFADM